MELDELIENTLRRNKHLEEMLSRPEREHTPLEGMDDDLIKRFSLFLYEENQNKQKQQDEMIARLDEIGKDLKDVKHENTSLLKALLEANINAEKVVLEYKLHDKEYKELEKKYNALVERLSLMNSQVYSSSKSLKGIDRKKSCKGKHDDKDDFDGTPQSPVPTEKVAEQPQESKTPKKSKERLERKGLTYRKQVVGTPIIHNSDYGRIQAGAVVISSSYKKVRNIVSHIEEPHFEEVKIKHPDGRIEKIYLPIKDESGTELYEEIVPGTHITGNLLPYLLNHYQMAIPAHREAKNQFYWYGSNVPSEPSELGRQGRLAAQQTDTCA